MIDHPSIALTGPRGVGKTTIADLLRERYGYGRHSWAAAVKELAVKAYGPIGKSDRVEVVRDGKLVVVTGLDIFQRIGTEAIREQVDEDFWVRVGLRSIRLGVYYVNDDTRFVNEAKMLHFAGWLVVRLMAGDECRARRLVARGDGDASTAHASEHWWEIEPDLVLDNTNENPEETLDHLIDLVVQQQQIKGAA